MMDDKLDAVLRQIDKKYGKGTVIRGSHYPPVPRVSSGIFSLDYEIGGGIPKGRVLIFTGNESAGKSTVAQKVVAQVQSLCRNCSSELVETEQGKECPKCKEETVYSKAFYCDIEGTFDPIWFRHLGGDPEELLLFQPEFAEQAVDVVEAVIRSGGVDIVVVDSIAMMSPATEIEKSAEDNMIGVHARLVNRMMRAIQSGFNSLGMGNRRKPTVILINQLRERVGVLFGDPYVMPGGRGQSFASSITVKFFARPSERLYESIGDKKPVGQQIRFSVEKNKTHPPHKQGIFTLYTDFSEEYGVVKGEVDNAAQIIRYGIKHGLIDKAGSWYTYRYGDEVLKAQGEDSIVAMLQDNKQILEDLKHQILIDAGLVQDNE